MNTSQILRPIIGTFAVDCVLVMACAACKVGSAGMVCTGNSAVGNAITIVVLVASPTIVILDELFELVLIQNFTTIHGLIWIGKRIAHPVIHAKIKVAHDENGGL